MYILSYLILLTLIRLRTYYFYAPIDLSIIESLSGGPPPLVGDQMKAHFCSYQVALPNSFPIEIMFLDKSCFVNMFLF